ncbi:hypothetical protein V8F06_013679 [Rhypophila decipiens]
MSSDSEIAYDVHVGAWTDWSRGKVLGATLTVTGEDGGFLIAFLAFFVALVGTRFWRITCLALHFLFSRDTPTDGVHHQRQAFLRNAPNPEAAVWTLASMGLSWRHHANKVWARLLTLIGLAVACFVGFILAGGYSSRAATFASGSNEALLSGANCGFFGNNKNMSTYGITLGPVLAQNMIAAESYARQCYTPVQTSVTCNTFVKKQIPPAIVDTNASCPFDFNLCKSMTGNLFLDTGFLDSHDHFGRNTPPTQRMQFRRTVHCAPLAIEGYRTKNQSYTTYYYGPLENVNQSATRNYTAQFSRDVYPDIEELTHNSGDTVHDFSVRYHYANFRNGSLDPEGSSFFPILELASQSALLFIFFLTSGRILFSYPTDDGWYGETTNTTDILKLKGVLRGNTTMYRQSEPGSPLACKELEQYCFTGVKGQRKCSPLVNRRDAMQSVIAQLDDGDMVWFDWFELTTFETTVTTLDPLALLGTQVLTARDSLNGPILGRFPDNQWQLEVQHWHATVMAHMQDTFLRSIVGPKNRISHFSCMSDTQRPRSKRSYVETSIVSITAIFLGGALIILLSFTLDSILPWCLHRMGWTRYSKLEWSSNETLQLQRLAHEASGTGTWSRGTGSIPVTQPGDLLAVLDISDPAHPRLRAGEVNGILEGDKKTTSGLNKAVEVMVRSESTTLDQRNSGSLVVE